MEQQPITPQQALQILDAIAAQMPGTRNDHAVSLQAIEALRPLVEQYTRWQAAQQRGNGASPPAPTS